MIDGLHYRPNQTLPIRLNEKSFLFSGNKRLNLWPELLLLIHGQPVDTRRARDCLEFGYPFIGEMTAINSIQTEQTLFIT